MTLKIKRKNGDITDLNNFCDLRSCQEEYGCKREEYIWVPSAAHDGWRCIKKRYILFQFSELYIWKNLIEKKYKDKNSLILQFTPGPDVFTLCE